MKENISKELRTVLEKVAKQNNVTIGEVLNEIQDATETAMKNPNPGAKGFWKKVRNDEQPPEPEELMLALLNSLVQEGIL
ncbi:MAG: hypothetical protein ACRC3H_21855 [Lachnospiraceae bacterium]